MKQFPTVYYVTSLTFLMSGCSQICSELACQIFQIFYLVLGDQMCSDLVKSDFV